MRANNSGNRAPSPGIASLHYLSKAASKGRLILAVSFYAFFYTVQQCLQAS